MSATAPESERQAAAPRQPATARSPLHASLDRMGALVGAGRTDIKSIRLSRPIADLRQALNDEVDFLSRQGDPAHSERQLLASLERYVDGDLS